MNEVAKLEARIATLSTRQNPVSFACGIALAAIDLWWQYTVNHWIATYTWMVPFALGFCAPRLVFAWVITRLDERRRELVDPSSACELPSARVVAPSARGVVAPTARAAAPTARGAA